MPAPTMPERFAFRASAVLKDRLVDKAKSLNISLGELIIRHLCACEGLDASEHLPPRLPPGRPPTTAKKKPRKPRPRKKGATP